MIVFLLRKPAACGFAISGQLLKVVSKLINSGTGEMPVWQNLWFPITGEMPDC